MSLSIITDNSNPIGSSLPVVIIVIVIVVAIAIAIAIANVKVIILATIISFIYGDHYEVIAHVLCLILNRIMVGPNFKNYTDRSLQTR